MHRARCEQAQARTVRSRQAHQGAILQLCVQSPSRIRAWSRTNDIKTAFDHDFTLHACARRQNRKPNASKTEGRARGSLVTRVVAPNAESLLCAEPTQKNLSTALCNCWSVSVRQNAYRSPHLATPASQQRARWTRDYPLVRHWTYGRRRCSYIPFIQGSAT
jgi:hypothetical protein